MKNNAEKPSLNTLNSPRTEGLDVLSNQPYANIYFEKDSSFIDNDILYPFRTHIQTTYGKKLMVAAHYHEHIEILYAIKGSFSIFLDDRIHYFTVGDMVVINSMDVHTTQSNDEGENSYIVIRFMPELLYTSSQTIFEAKYVLPFTMKTVKHQKIFTSAEISKSYLPDLIKNILHEDLSREYGFELAIRTNIGGIFLWILRNWQKEGVCFNFREGLDQITIERLQLVFDYVNHNFEQPISVNDMAKLCNMSYSYFSRFFKKTMQRNFSDYVNLIRISKAEHLLCSTDDSITNIGYSVGFTTTSYFIEQFKYFKNMTPKKFRSKIHH